MSMAIAHSLYHSPPRCADGSARRNGLEENAVFEGENREKILDFLTRRATPALRAWAQWGQRGLCARRRSLRALAIGTCELTAGSWRHLVPDWDAGHQEEKPGDGAHRQEQRKRARLQPPSHHPQYAPDRDDDVEGRHDEERYRDEPEVISVGAGRGIEEDALTHDPLRYGYCRPHAPGREKGKCDDENEQPRDSTLPRERSLVTQDVLRSGAEGVHGGIKTKTPCA